MHRLGRYAPGVAVVFSIAILATHLGPISSQLGWNGDVASRYMLGATLTHNAPGGRVFTTEVGYTWLNAATKGLPGHRTIWELYPFAIMVAALALLTWTLWRLAGRTAAALGAALAATATPAVLLSEAAQAFHGIAYAAMIALDALLVAVALSKQSRATLVGAGAVALIVGAAAATDPLLVVIGIIPAGVGAVVVLLRHRGWAPVRKVADTGVFLAVGSAVVTVAGLLLLHHFGFADLIPGGTTHARFATISGLKDHANLAAIGLLDLTAGLPYDSSSIVPWRAAIGALMLVAFAAASIAAVWRVLRNGDSPARTVHVTFWASSAVLLFAAFVVSDVVSGTVYLEPTGRLLASVRYLVPLFFVGVALVPLWADRGGVRVALATVGMAIFALWSGIAVVQATDAHAFEPHAALRIPTLIAALESHGLTRGYTSYWDASPITWNTDDRIEAFPAAEDAPCGSSSTDGAVCGYSLNSESGWYRPSASPTFIVVDPEHDYMSTAPSQTIFGTPRDVFTVSDFQVFVYDFDVATRFLHTCAGRGDHGC
jgi:hypothetical protein